VTERSDNDALVGQRTRLAWVDGVDLTGDARDDLGVRRLDLGQPGTPLSPDLARLLGGSGDAVGPGVSLECSVDDGERRGWLVVRQDGTVAVGRGAAEVEAEFPTGVRAWWCDDGLPGTESEAFDLVLDGPPLVRTSLPTVYRSAVLHALTRTFGERTTW